MRLQSPKVIAVSVVGVAISYILALYTRPYQFGAILALPQVGVFLAACAGGPIWGIAAGLAGGLRLYYDGSGTTWLYVLLLLGLFAGLLSYKVRPAGASIISWVPFGLIASYVIYSQSALPSQALYAWLTSFSYEVAVSAVVVEAVLVLLHISRVRKKKEEKEKVAVPSEAQAELGL